MGVVIIIAVLIALIMFRRQIWAVLVVVVPVLVGVALLLWTLSDIPFLIDTLGPVGALAVIGGSFALWLWRRRR